MNEPTPIRKRRQYTRRDKAEVVGLAEVKGVRRAARESGVPVSTVESWRMSSEFAQLRTQKREDVAQEVWAAFQTGIHRLIELIPQTDDLGKVAVATGVIFDKYALMSGEATSRNETRDLTARLNEAQADGLMNDIDEWLASRAVDADA